MSEHPVFDRIRDEIGKNDVLLFMKGTPVFPQCGFSAAVVDVLSQLGVKFHGINILVDPATCARASRNSASGRPSPSST